MGVHTYEVWNEPNLAGFWKPVADPVRYTELLKAAYLAIKQADPLATVVSGGLAPALTSGGDIDAREFAQAMYANGAQGYFDALGHHRTRTRRRRGMRRTGVAGTRCTALRTTSARR